MSRLKAQRKLHAAAQDGRNWRFKGLLLAALDSEISARDMAEAWPDSGSKSDYRFLSAVPNRNPEAEQSRKVVAERGEDRYRWLSDYAGDNDRVPKHLSSKKPKELGDKALGAHLDSAIKRTLFATDSYTELDTLFREQLLDTVMEGAQKRRWARDAVNVINANTRVGDVTVAEDDTYADDTGEGAAIRDDGEGYATIEWDTVKKTKGARVTEEMVDQANVDLISRNIERIGGAIENSINRVVLNEMLDNAANSFDTEGSDLGVPALNGAVGEVDKEDFMPNGFVSHPEFRTELFDDTNLVRVNYAGNDEVLRDREINTVMGLEHYPASGGTYNGDSETWGFSSDGEKGGVVFDNEHIHLILYNANGNDIEIKDYEDPIRDLNGVNGRLWVDSDFSQERAAATVQY